MSLFAKIKKPGPNGFGYGSTAEQVTDGVDLTGKTILVTGVNSGLGLETMRVLVKRGATVIGAARTLEKARSACARHGDRALPVECELSEPASVLRAVETIRSSCDRLDAIITNAGIMALPERTVKYGLELQFLTNHIGHFLLVTRLLDHLADDGRVVAVSSMAHRGAPAQGILFDALNGDDWYTPWLAYGQSKLANALFAAELARRFEAEGSKRVANSLHPGVIKTNLARHFNPLIQWSMNIAEMFFLKSIPQGAATQVYLAAHPDAGNVNGEYFDDVNVGNPTDHVQDASMARRLWEVSEEIVARLLDETNSDTGR